MQEAKKKRIGWKHSEATKELCRQRKLGQRHSPEAIERISAGVRQSYQRKKALAVMPPEIYEEPPPEESFYEFD